MIKLNLQLFAGGDVAIALDTNSDPAPQYFDPDTGASGTYEYQEGRDGASHVLARTEFKTTAFESVTVTATSGGLTSGTYGTATRAVLTVEDASIRVRSDGTSPTASEGHLVEPGSTIVLESADELSNFEAIRTGATSAVIKASYQEVA